MYRNIPRLLILPQFQEVIKMKDQLPIPPKRSIVNPNWAKWLDEALPLLRDGIDGEGKEWFICFCVNRLLIQPGQVDRSNRQEFEDLKDEISDRITPDNWNGAFNTATYETWLESVGIQWRHYTLVERQDGRIRWVRRLIEEFKG